MQRGDGEDKGASGCRTFSVLILAVWHIRMYMCTGHDVKSVHFIHSSFF